MKLLPLLLLLLTTLLAASAIKAPAVPLIAQSPYISVWAQSESLADKVTTHWTGKEVQIAVLAKIDGVAYRLVGPYPSNVPTLHQKSIVINPTQTIAVFEDDKATVSLQLTFTTPAIPENETLLALPVTFIDLEAESLDNQGHDIEFYFDTTEQLLYNDRVAISSGVSETDNLKILKIGTEKQTPLSSKGDWMRIDWGYSYIAALKTTLLNASIGSVSDSRSAFCGMSAMSSDVDLIGTSMSVNMPVSPSNNAKSVILFAYDEIDVMNYFGNVLQPAWKTQYGDIPTLLDAMILTSGDLTEFCHAYDSSLVAKLTSISPEYSFMSALVFRQVTASLTLTMSGSGSEGELYVFMKEISSDGDINTVDVMFPASPFFLYTNPNLLAKMLLPVLMYANNETDVKYNLEWCPHHLGVWPIADIIPSKQEQMPDEESADMLMMLAGVSKKFGSTDFMSKYMPLIGTWADFLVAHGLDPGKQLCSDDFEGPSEHNANLALKSIIGIAAYSVILDIDGQPDKAKQYLDVADSYAIKWKTLALDTYSEAKDHYALQYLYNKTSWSQKYNLIWDVLLGTHVFPQDVIDMELEYYSSKSTNYSIPLDCRKPWAKADWTSWTASLGSDEYFRDAMSKIGAWVDQSLQNWPFGDFYDTASGLPLIFRARPVLGAFYMKILVDSV